MYIFILEISIIIIFETNFDTQFFLFINGNVTIIFLNTFKYELLCYYQIFEKIIYYFTVNGYVF